MKNTSSSLVAMAQSAAQQAYVPYSKFKVGAVLSFANGATVTGCNIENVSYGLTNCAERTAIFSAIAQGFDPRQISSLVVFTPSDQVYSPCGACRQVMTEFLAPDTKVISACYQGQREWTLAELLPDAFHFDINEYRD
ncbi:MULTISPECIES: cytidine deaminase [Pseudidiomarina]|uniref:Cytidine deaminase n=2 Tax=Pseudidiomarina TaxID=2800384 RepID=A0A368UR73_9GAMM|nr:MULTISPECIES: cytidine deaminase [Pseudidiomarina]PWW11340.1 cytidine deaminase [Pseudidiomarina maritima]RBP88824.1 cytidine deaminase [Pseudidiomarina tainanensis]RCW30655.1 cytidine deaminase [Pseudidiomarina tainanensis]